MTQKICPICMHKLFAAEAHTDMTSMRSALHRLHFDHFLRALKGEDIGGTYNNTDYWYNTPLCLLITPAKKSGYFVHADWHQKR